MAELLKRGFDVLTPFGDNARYDLVVDVNGKFIRIQCKTGRIKNGKIIFSTASKSTRTQINKNNYRGQIEFFAIYTYENKKTYLVPVDDIGIDTGYLRIEPTKNNQIKNIRWANEYELDNQLNNINNT